MSDAPSRSSAPSSDEGTGAIESGSGQTLDTGSVLAERYRLRQLIGRGGMGAVWEAEHIVLGQAVAIKLIRPELASNERSRARFLREAQAAAGLQSPNVVQIFDYGVEEGTPYIAMERLEGESLAERLRRVGRLPPEQLVAVITQVARAIGKAHAAGVVHRDLKPDNVFIVSDEDGDRCKVLDFGIAKVVPGGGLELAPGAETNTNTMVGTPFYMSPEQATDSKEVGPRSDLWSMAVIAYECLVGARPFDGPTLPTLAVKILAEPIPVPSEHAPVPPGFDRWFARATQREPDERFGSAREMAVALAEALAVTVTSVSVSMPPVPRRRRRMGVPVVLAGLVAGLGAWWVVGGGGDRPPADRSSDAEVVHPRTSASASDSDAVPVARSTESGASGGASADAAESGESGERPEAPAPTPGSVTLSLQGPDGASVFRGDTLLGMLPEPVSVPRSDEAIVLRIVAAGYEPLEVSVVPDVDRTLTLTPAKKRRGPASGRKPRMSDDAKSNVDDLEF